MAAPADAAEVFAGEPVETEGDEIELQEPSVEEEAFIQYDHNSGNFAFELYETQVGRDVLDGICEEVLQKFERDWESTQDFRERQARDMKIFMGMLEQKVFPFEHSANAHVPIMLENLSRLQSRIIAEIFGDWTMVVGVMPVGEDDEDLADLLTMHTNWQFREQIKNFRRQIDRAMLSFLLIGDVVMCSYYDESRSENRHEALMPDEFVTPYDYVTTEPDFSDLPHYCHIKRLYPHELEAMEGKWAKVDEVLGDVPDQHEEEPDAPLRRAVADVEGQEEPSDDDDAPYKIVQFEGWLKLPNQERHRWCQVIIHEARRTILSISIHEEPDWRDQQRYEREIQERDAYAMQVNMWRSTQANAELASIAAEQSLATDETTPEQDMAAAGAIEQLNQVQQAPLPDAPIWMADPEDLTEDPRPVRTRPICMYSHGVCLENLVGNIGMGMGRIEADFNRAANTALSQFTDGATLANCWSLITTQNIRFDAPFTMKPGAINKARGVTGAELKNNIMELRAQPANGQLVELVDKFYQYGQSAIQAPNVLSGEPGKSGETYRGIATRIEQATKQLSTLAQRFAIPLKQVYENNAKLNSMFLDDMEVVHLLNHMSRKMQTVRVGRSMYQRDYRVEFRSDMKFTSEAQRISEADQMVQMPAAVPALQQNFAFQYETVKQALEARGKYELVALLGNRPPPPPMFGPPPPPPGPGGPPPPGGPAASQAPPANA